MRSGRPSRTVPERDGPRAVADPSTVTIASGVVDPGRLPGDDNPFYATFTVADTAGTCAAGVVHVTADRVTAVVVEPPTGACHADRVDPTTGSQPTG